jgi:hypothetical protein
VEREWRELERVERVEREWRELERVERAKRVESAKRAESFGFLFSKNKQKRKKKNFDCKHKYFAEAERLADRCRTFDAAGGGYAPGEACGVLVLKRLDNAIANGYELQNRLVWEVF